MSAESAQARGENLIPNGDFSRGRIASLPEGWEFTSPYPHLRPVFRLVRREGGRALLATGGGNPDCVGWVRTPVRVQGGRSYQMGVRLRMSGGLNPQQHLLFALYAGERLEYNNGIFRFRRVLDSWVEGEGRFRLPGEGEMPGEVRVYFRHSARGKAWIQRVWLEECAPIPPRPVRIACTHGTGDLESWGQVLAAAAAAEVDLVLLPETFNGTQPEPLDGPSGRLMSQWATEGEMYVCGGLLYHEPEANRVFNAALLYDRQGRLAGRYYKNHPYSPEIFEGVTPGTEVPVFDTDFARLGIIVCYDSWFGDVTELLALKGAEIVLFPSAGFYRSLMPARSADNCVRVVASSLHSGLGIWDTMGSDITNPEADQTRGATIEHPTFEGVEVRKVGEIELLTATLDLSRSPSPHNWGGPLLSAPGGRRNRREQKRLLYRDIERETLRWWEEEGDSG